MKRIYPFLYLFVVYGLICLMLLFEVDPGPFIPIVLVVGAGALNIYGSYLLAKEEEDKTLKLNAVILFVFLLPICVMIVYFMYAILALTAASTKEAVIFILTCLLVCRIVLLPASFYLYQHLKVKGSSLVFRILAFLPGLWLIPLIAG